MRKQKLTVGNVAGKIELSKTEGSNLNFPWNLLGSDPAKWFVVDYVIGNDLPCQLWICHQKQIRKTRFNGDLGKSFILWHQKR